jgi:hypothetical protein
MDMSKPQRLTDVEAAAKELAGEISDVVVRMPSFDKSDGRPAIAKPLSRMRVR